MSQDPCWKVFIRHAGNERRLSGIFWMSSSQIDLYWRFSDVVLNDNTCKTNKYNMYLSEFMIKNFPKCQNYMTRALYANRVSWAKAYTPFQFNASIQSTQSVESFNGIIKKSLNSSSTLCDIEKTIDKRHEEEARYCKLTD